jgi:hypothetical protein
MEMPAVKTTIVGGRPPGCGKMLGDIPRGIEVLVKKASVDPAFRALLLARRSAAAGEIGLLLAPAEAMMLDHVPQAQLEAIINRTKVDPSRRNAFLSKAAGVMLAALGASAVVSCDDVALSKGVRPDPNSPSAATAPATLPASKPATGPVSHGVRADAPALRGAGGDGVLAQADEPPPPPPPAPQRPIMRVAGVIVGPVGTDNPPRPPPVSAPAQTQPADPSTNSGQGQPPEPPPMLIAGLMAVPRPVPATQPASKPTSSPASQPSSQPVLSPKEYDALVKQLDDDNYTVREAAQTKLQAQGIRILPALRETLGSDQLSAEVRSRLESTVNTLAATTQPVRPTDIQARRGLRAVP